MVTYGTYRRLYDLQFEDVEAELPEPSRFG